MISSSHFWGKIRRAGRLPVRTFTRFIRYQGPLQSSALAFSTFLALVPLTGVLFAFSDLSGIGTEIEAFLADILLPTGQEIILNALRAFAENSRTLGTLGLLFFLVTAVLLLVRIENTLNRIFGGGKQRSLSRRITTYTTLFVFGSLLLAGSSATVRRSLLFLRSSLDFWLRPLSPGLGGILLSLVLLILALLFLFMLLPTTRLRFRAAFAGALTGGAAWYGARSLFSWWAARSVRLSVIYGSLFLIPVLLIWLSIGWSIILYAAHLSWLIHHGAPERARDLDRPWDRLKAGLDLLTEVCRDFRDGRPPEAVHRLGARAGLDAGEAESLLSILRGAGLVRQVRERRHIGFVPGRPPEKLSIVRCLEALAGAPEPPTDDWRPFRDDGETVADRLDRQSPDES